MSEGAEHVPADGRGDHEPMTSRASRFVTVIAAVAIAVSIGLATIMITNRLTVTEDKLSAALIIDNSICNEAGSVKTYCLLDQGFAKRRYALAAAGVSAALWTRLFICVAGLILVAVGSIFILMKLEISQTAVEAKGSRIGVGLKTSSPGLALTLLGGALLAAAAYTPARFDMSDGPSHLFPIKPPLAAANLADRINDDGGAPGPVKVPRRGKKQ
jgi:hypothetical protein